MSAGKPPITSDQTVLLTGGSVGLGLELAKQFVANGNWVFVCARSEADLARAALDVPGLSTIVADVSNPNHQRRLFAQIEATGRFVDVLINNAAIVKAHDYLSDFTLNEDRARPELEINFAAPIELGRLFLQARRAAGREALPGALVNVGTPGALFPLEAEPLYCATKAGLHMFTLTLRRQLRESPVHVIEVFPPGLPTALARELEVSSDGADPKVVTEVAIEIFDDIMAGTEVSLPHPQSRALYAAVPQMDADYIDVINSGVRRRPGWDH
jgi:uncharacterized oxidoreductase